MISWSRNQRAVSGGRMIRPARRVPSGTTSTTSSSVGVGCLAATIRSYPAGCGQGRSEVAASGRSAIPGASALCSSICSRPTHTPQYRGQTSEYRGIAGWRASTAAVPLTRSCRGVNRALTNRR
jgi:hypothetical protein